MFKQNQQSKILLLFSRAVATFKKAVLTNSHKCGLFPAHAQIFSCKLAIIPACALLGILALTSILFISSDSASNSYALDGANLQSEVTAEIDGTHYVTLSASDATFSITPTNGTASDKKQVDVELSTNVSGGASLYLSTSSDKNALYLNGDTNSTSQNIASASSTTTYDNMANNTWAYSTDDINYQGVPTLDSPVLLSDIDGISTGTNTNGVVSATIPIYYAAKVDTSIPSGSYANSVTYLAVVDGGIVTNAELTSITINNSSNQPEVVEQLQLDTTNTILITTNLKTNTYGTPRVYYTTISPSGYAECGNVVVASNTEGYMTIQCETTPTTVATGLTLHIVPKGTPSSTNPSEMTGDPFCSDGTYEANTSQCKAGEWKWGSFTVELPNIIRLRNMSEISSMQEMTPEFCASVTDKAPGNTARLQDTRDGKYYWVAKLADGNCWMTQNLELDLGGRTLTPQDSDVSSNWDHDAVGGNAYTSAQDGTGNSSLIQSWNLGKVVWKTPDSTGYCSGSGVYDFTNSACQAYWQDVSTWAPMTEYRTDGVTYDDNTQTYDAHYLTGNYYSYVAATAGSGASVTTSGDKAPDSICPAGWELPTTDSAYDSTPGSFYNLLMNAYGLSSNSTGGTAMRSAPLFFVRSGNVFSYRDYLSEAGSRGDYWSSVSGSSGMACHLRFLSSRITPLSYTDGYNGKSVRCVAPSAQSA